MKKLDSRFLVICGIIISLPIIFILFMILIRGCGEQKKSYSKYEDMMISRAKSYAKRHKMFPNRGSEVILKLADLIDDGLKSPDKVLNDSNCSGSVIIINNSKDGEEFYNYIPYLECNNYKTKYIKDYLMEDVVTTGSGLYKVGDEFIFKGNKVNNYLSFYGTIYRIIKIDDKGYLKLIKEKNQEISINWDNKYNINRKDYTGINNYRDSVIVDRLLDDYSSDKNFTDQSRAKIISHSICIGKRNVNDLSINITTECNEKLDDQIISLPSITDYTLASYDGNCNSVESLSCTNYNYFADFIDYTWTVDTVTDDDSLVYYIDSSGPSLEEANKYKKYNWILYIDGEELYQSGKGTEKNPYIIK